MLAQIAPQPIYRCAPERSAMIYDNRRGAALGALRARRMMQAASSPLQRETWRYILNGRRQDLAYWNTYSRTFAYRAVRQ